MDSKQDLTLLIAGVDEVGRGPLAGAVLAAAVILDPARPIKGVADSKSLTPSRREVLYDLILAQCIAYGVGRAEVAEIDEINIFQASLLAMKRAVENLPVAPHEVLVDGTHCPAVAYPARAIIQGDQTVTAISAASIIAKVTRDREMKQLDLLYPQYGFAQHKGYSTAAHLQALKKYGACEIHRRSFAPVAEVLKLYES